MIRLAAVWQQAGFVKHERAEVSWKSTVKMRRRNMRVRRNSMLQNITATILSLYHLISFIKRCIYILLNMFLCYGLITELNWLKLFVTVGLKSRKVIKVIKGRGQKSINFNEVSLIFTKEENMKHRFLILID